MTKHISMSDLARCVGGGTTRVVNADKQEATLTPVGYDAGNNNPIRIPAAGSADIPNCAFNMKFGGQPSSHFGNATWSALGQPMKISRYQVDYAAPQKR
jgi:hypothetical protein